MADIIGTVIDYAGRGWVFVEQGGWILIVICGAWWLVGCAERSRLDRIEHLTDLEDRGIPFADELALQQRISIHATLEKIAIILGAALLLLAALVWKMIGAATWPELFT